MVACLDLVQWNMMQVIEAGLIRKLADSSS